MHVFECGFDIYKVGDAKRLQKLYAVFYDTCASNLIIKMSKDKKMEVRLRDYDLYCCAKYSYYFLKPPDSGFQIDILSRLSITVHNTH